MTMNFTILRFDSLDSTNTEALRQARQGAREGLCVIANQQTAGRGRHGRAWESPQGEGLYLSFVLRPTLASEDLPLITLMTGVAVYDTLVEIGLKPDIKWPNDVLVNERKISGILAEMTEDRSTPAIVVGIGVNLTSKKFPSEIAETATSIESELKRNITAADLETALLKYLGYFYGILNEGGGSRAIVDEWRRRSTYADGKLVRVAFENGSTTGITDGIEPNGALRVRSSDGYVSIIQAGDVQRLRERTD